MILLLLLASLDCPPIPVGPSPSPLVFTNQTCIRQTWRVSSGVFDRFAVGFDVSTNRTYHVQVATQLTEPMVWQPGPAFKPSVEGRSFVEFWYPRGNWIAVGEVTARFYRVMHD